MHTQHREEKTGLPVPVLPYPSVDGQRALEPRVDLDQHAIANTIREKKHAEETGTSDGSEAVISVWESSSESARRLDDHIPD